MEFLVVLNTLVLILAGSLITWNLSSRAKKARAKALSIKNET